MFVTAVAANVDREVIAKQQYTLDNCQVNELTKNLAEEDDNNDSPLKSHFEFSANLVSENIDIGSYHTFISIKAFGINVRAPPHNS